MAKFIRVTEVRTVRRTDTICALWKEEKTPILINPDFIVKIEDKLIHLSEFRIRVDESFDELVKLLAD